MDANSPQVIVGRMVVELLKESSVFAMLTCDFLFPDVGAELVLHIKKLSANGGDANDEAAYDFLQSHIGGIRRTEGATPDECFRSLYIAAMRKALAEVV